MYTNTDRKFKNRPLFPSGYKKKNKTKLKKNAIKIDEKNNKIEFHFGRFILQF
jgi:hypothetical protein